MNTEKERLSRIDVYAMIGERVGDKCKLRTGWGISHATSKGAKNRVSYQHCYWEWFTKKCETRYKYVDRSLTLTEITKVKIGMIRRAHKNAAKKFASSTRLFGKQDSSEITLADNMV